MAKIEITPAGGGAVASVFTRTGAVVATTGDYTAAQVTNAADKSTGSVQSFTAAVTSAGDVAAHLNATPQVNLTAAGNTAQIVFGRSGTPGTISNAAAGSPGNFTVNALWTVQAGIATTAITSGALPTITPSSGTGIQCSTTRDVFLHQICTFNPTAGATATCVVALSPDNVTYSTLITVTIPAGVTFDGTIPPISLQVPAGWYVKFTTTNAVLGTGTYY